MIQQYSIQHYSYSYPDLVTYVFEFSTEHILKYNMREYKEHVESFFLRMCECGLFCRVFVVLFLYPSRSLSCKLDREPEISLS